MSMHENFVDGGNVAAPTSRITFTFRLYGELAERMDVLLTSAQTQGIMIHGQWTYHEHRLDAINITFEGIHNKLVAFLKFVSYLMHNPTKPFPPATSDILHAGLQDAPWPPESPHDYEIAFGNMWVDGLEAQTLDRLFQHAVSLGAYIVGEYRYVNDVLVAKDFSIASTETIVYALRPKVKTILDAYLERVNGS